MRLTIMLFVLAISTTGYCYAQSDSLKTTVAEHTYPQVKGYTGLVHPLYTWSKDGNTSNFTNSYIVGNPWGINIWKSKRFGVSFELTPFLKITSQDSKVSNVLFHPGVLYRLGHEYTLIGRVAYETSGRFGFTPILNKVVVRGKSSTFFIALLFPVRFGNNHAPSLSTAFQFGIGF